MPSMCPDYYWTLGLSRYASDADVRKAYRKLALRWHPSKFPEQRLQAEAKFREISEAFEVLSNKSRRMMFDKHGRQGLLDVEDVGIILDGVRLPTSSSDTPKRPGGMASFRDPYEVFYETFGSRDLPKVNVLQHTTPFADGVQTDGVVVNRFLHDKQRFQHSFPGFALPSTTVKSKPAPLPSGVVTSFKSFVFSGPPDSGDYRTVSESTRVINGRQIVTKRNIINGRETVTVEEDGVLVSKTIDDQQVDLY